MTLLASITRRGLGPCLAVEGATTREVFEAYLEYVLAPILRPGQRVMDNLSAHRNRKVKKSARIGVGSSSTYSLAQAISKDKGFVRRAEARTRESLIEATGPTLKAASARDARDFRALGAVETPAHFEDVSERHRAHSRTSCVPSGSRTCLGSLP